MLNIIEIINQQEQFLDNENKPCLGKLTVLKLSSTSLAEIYTFNHGELTVSSNPVYTNGNGRLTQSIFANPGIYQIGLYKYIGEITPSSDTDDNNWEFVRNYYVGLEQSIAKEEHNVNSINELRNIATSYSPVRVTGYWNENDCEPRTYIWDSNCTDDEDGGFVINSNINENGAWVLLFDGSWLPSSYYGVYPGHEENINALLTYSSSVGSFNEKTPTGIAFKSGNYSGGTTALLTNKSLMIDGNTRFTRQYISAASVTVNGEVSSYICDFYIDGGEVRSSWYKTLKGFWNSGANKFIVDSNSFIDTTMTNLTVSDAIIEFHKTISANKVKFNNCTFIGSRMLDTTETISFNKMNVTDDWFSSSTLDVSNLTFTTCTFHKDNFNKLTNYLKCIEKVATGSNNVLDMEGHNIPTENIVLSKYSDIRNFTVNILQVLDQEILTLRNVKCNALELSSTVKYLYLYDSEVAFNSQPEGLISMIIEGGKVSGTTDWNGEVQIQAKNCDYSLGRLSDTYTLDKGIALTKCTIKDTDIKSSSMQFIDCVFTNSNIEVYPYTENDNRKLDFYFTGNSYNSSNPIKIMGRDSNEDAWSEIIASINISNNTFIGNELGITCRYKSGIIIKPWLSANSAFVYKNNGGFCPQERLQTNLTVTTDNWQSVADQHYVYTSKAYRVFNIATTDITNGKFLFGENCADTLAVGGLADDSTPALFYANKGYLFLTHRNKVISSDNDLFNCYISSNSANHIIIHTC